MALYHPTYSLFLAASMLAAITSSSALSATANTNKNNRHHNISPPAAAAAAMTNTKLIRCAVVGVGVLGTSLCRQILREWDDDDDNDNDSQPGVVVVGITKTVTHHDVIRERVFGGVGEATGDRFRLVAVEEDLDSTAAGHVDDEKFQNVVFCAPPSGSEDYPAAVKEAAEKYWAGPDAGGVFVFTSSGAVYGSGDVRTVTETSTLADASSSPRVARLVNAELACLKAGGCCLRLAGLYDLQRGPHNYWITSEKGIPSSPDGIINMLHYDDAASACLAALKAGPTVCKGKCFLISDGHPSTRNEICQSALKASAYKGYGMPKFTGGDDQPVDLGKVYNGSASNAALKWSPKNKSFEQFMEANA